MSFVRSSRSASSEAPVRRRSEPSAAYSDDIALDRLVGVGIGGAMLGASLGGPVGALIGAVVGLALGHIVNSAEREKAIDHDP